MQIRFFIKNRPDFYLEKYRSVFFIKNRADFYLKNADQILFKTEQIFI